MPTRPRAPLRFGVAWVVALAVVFAITVPAVLAASRGVAIRDFAFAPRMVEIRVGDTVRWTNSDSVAHTATGRSGSFDTGLLEPGASGSIRFTAAGTYRYVCTPHPEMTGAVVVRAARTGVVPPNTATGVADADATADSQVPLLATVGGLAVLIVGTFAADRRFRPRG